MAPKTLVDGYNDQDCRLYHNGRLHAAVRVRFGQDPPLVAASDDHPRTDEPTIPDDAFFLPGAWWHTSNVQEQTSDRARHISVYLKGRDLDHRGTDLD